MQGTVDQRWYQTSFETFEKSLNGEAASSIHSIRQSAFRRFAELGFPTTRNEDWKYTDLSPLTSIRFKPVLGYDSRLLADDIRPFLFAHSDWNRLVFVNGHFSKDLSVLRGLPSGVEVRSMAETLKDRSASLESHLTKYAGYDTNAFTELSTAFLRDGAFVWIPKKEVLEHPIHLLFISTKTDQEFVSHPRNLVIAEESSQAALLETHVTVGQHVYFTNAVTEVVLGENAVVEYDKFQNESEMAFHVGSTYVRQHRNSNFASNVVLMGGRLVRNNVFVVLDGEGAEATLNGLYLGTGSQHIDNHTTIDHAKPHCNSYEWYKGILDGKSKGVFNGKIIVRKDAQKTDAKQTNKNLVLSDQASIDTKPQLEIYANDVKCTHGATIGQLDEEAMFYLRSRGVEASDARNILIHAFASDLIERIKSRGVREHLERLIYDRLDTEQGARKQ